MSPLYGCSDKKRGVTLVVTPLFAYTMKGETVDPDETTVVDSTTIDPASYQAKIDQLNATIAAHEKTLADRESELTAAKAANYDLLMNGTPKELDDTATVVVEDDSDSANVTIDDLFGGKN